MAARKSPKAGTAGVATDAGPGAQALLAGVLQRMGDVLGPGAIYSLVHYAAVEEGRRLTSGPAASGVEALVRRIAGHLGIDVRILGEKPGDVRLRLTPGPGFGLESRATTALVVGLLEGALTTTQRRKMQLKGDPAARGDGSLELEFTG